MSTTTKRKEEEGGGLGGSHPEEEETEPLLLPRKLPGVFLFPTSDLETERASARLSGNYAAC
jgi:hypothetical protein